MTHTLTATQTTEHRNCSRAVLTRTVECACTVSHYYNYQRETTGTGVYVEFVTILL